MFNHDFKPKAFNPDCIVNHEELSAKVSAKMEELEESFPLQTRKARAKRYKRVYENLSKGYKTYGEVWAEK